MRTRNQLCVTERSIQVHLGVFSIFTKYCQLENKVFQKEDREFQNENVKLTVLLQWKGIWKAHGGRVGWHHILCASPNHWTIYRMSSSENGECFWHCWGTAKPPELLVCWGAVSVCTVLCFQAAEQRAAVSVSGRGACVLRHKVIIQAKWHWTQMHSAVRWTKGDWFWYESIHIPEIVLS